MTDVQTQADIHEATAAHKPGNRHSWEVTDVLEWNAVNFMNGQFEKLLFVNFVIGWGCCSRRHVVYIVCIIWWWHVRSRLGIKKQKIERFFVHRRCSCYDLNRCSDKVLRETLGDKRLVYCTDWTVKTWCYAVVFSLNTDIWINTAVLGIWTKLRWTKVWRFSDYYFDATALDRSCMQINNRQCIVGYCSFTDSRFLVEEKRR